MTGDDLNWFQIAARVLFVVALGSYGVLGLTWLIRRRGSLMPRRPRVVTMRRHRELMRRQQP